MCDNCTALNTVEDFSIPDCSAGGFVGVHEQEPETWVKFNGNRLFFEPKTEVTSVQVYDLSMRLLLDVPQRSSTVELPTSLRGCMLVKVDAENHLTEMVKWCNF